MRRGERSCNTYAGLRSTRETNRRGRMKNEVDKRGGGEDNGSHTQSDTKDDKEEKKDGVGGRDKPQSDNGVQTTREVGSTDKPQGDDDNDVAQMTHALSFLKLSRQDHLNELERAVCSTCMKKRKYFCYTCMIPMGDPALAPHLSLPLSVDIIHHPTELLSKSTAIHARIICPDDVSIHEFPDIPDYNLDETVLLFPSDTASNLRDLDITNIKKVVFVDSQWQKTKRMMNDPRLARLNCVKIDMQKTLFWRYQSKGDECLATIEAIYYFFKEYHQKTHKGEYKGECDDLLYYYALFYGLIQDTYKKTNKEFPRINNYIKET